MVAYQVEARVGDSGANSHRPLRPHLELVIAAALG